MLRNLIKTFLESVTLTGHSECQSLEKDIVNFFVRFYGIEIKFSY